MTERQILSPQSLQERYTSISPEREVELGNILADRRQNAQSTAMARIAEMGLTDRIKLGVVGETTFWKSIARKDPAFIRARNEIVGGYSQYIAVCVDHFRGAQGNYVSDDDKQSGMAVAYEAAETFDNSIGTSFHDYLDESIKHELERVDIRDRPVHLPKAKVRLMDQAMLVYAELAQQLQRTPSLSEITDAMNSISPTKESKMTSIDVQSFFLLSDGVEPIVPRGLIEDDRVSFEAQDWELDAERQHVVYTEEEFERTDGVARTENQPESLVIDRRSIVELLKGLDLEDKQLLFNLFAKGQIDQDEADAKGVSRQAIYQRRLRLLRTIRSDANISVEEDGTGKRSELKTARRRSIAYRMFHQGHTYEDISRRLGVASTMIGEYIHDERIARGEATSSHPLAGRPKADDTSAQDRRKEVNEMLEQAGGQVTVRDVVERLGVAERTARLYLAEARRERLISRNGPDKSTKSLAIEGTAVQVQVAGEETTSDRNVGSPEKEVVLPRSDNIVTFDGDNDPNDLVVDGSKHVHFRDETTSEDNQVDTLRSGQDFSYALLPSDEMELPNDLHLTWMENEEPLRDER